MLPNFVSKISIFFDYQGSVDDFYFDIRAAIFKKCDKIKINCGQLWCTWVNVFMEIT